MCSEPVIHAEGLGKCYELYRKPSHRLWQAMSRGRAKFFDEFWALRDIGFEVARGECVGILGANGSGKSTLLQLIAGTLTPTTGRVETVGRVAALLELGSGFHGEFTGRENVYLNGAILGLSRNDLSARMSRIADFADIGDFLDRPVKIYSSGMLLRLAFAVQVQIEPDILIVDEALAVGDAKFQLKCFKRMEELLSRGTTLLFVSHSLQQVKQFCTRAILLNQGQLVADADPVDCGVEYYRLLFPSGPDNSPPAPPAATDSDEDYQPDLRKAKTFGRGGVNLTELRVRGIQPPNLIRGGDELIMRARFELDRQRIAALAAEKPCEDILQFALRFENAQGVTLTSAFTGPGEEGAAGIALADLADGEPVTMEFRVRLPRLAPGEYYLSLGTALGRTGQTTPLLEYVHLISLICIQQELIMGLSKWDYTIRRVGESSDRGGQKD
jgi:lipopolysaccharide transport system ATP-binding protein